ncbi:beta-ketoacyl-[acyl-carrier-protein] synthase family protein [Solirubrobacter ginsenosidimutans]|uniref:Beta-ketoacyl-[acyl-carrier-protein] synthase family protein n=1 Tax=Solirubrobacter ginsenosidimutans TaxID=490573 RepID=A0A9X3N119_9ACTN|nr:beta-ketoacyl-[acyl-carrier-protein] synthase family protein [Solirubrobacter ginsenosidimutans]MDA0166504.1 beta-ketoacyl-[acyl-carrier-protein] synthase family protein [Solirubrobacter ginsenosidimutans]
MNRRVALTGIGAVTPVGNDTESTWSALVAGRSGVRRITTFDASTYPVRIAGQVEGFDVRERLVDTRIARHLSRSAGFGVGAALEALENARAHGAYAPWERGVSIGTSVGRPEPEDLAEIAAAQAGPGTLVRQAPSQVVRRGQNTAAATIAHVAGCAGPLIGVSTACTASAQALGEAMRRIQEGDARLMVAGGCDALTTWLDVLGFSLLGALTTEYDDAPERASRPFDRRRSGFVLGEGAVVAVLEDWDSAVERGAPILAELAGYGSTLNAYRLTDAPPDGGGAIGAMASALREGGIAPTDVDYVSAHGTSTPGNDSSETLAIKRVLGEHAHNVAVSSPKSMTGHMTAAAAGLNLLAAVLAMRDGVVSPTLNLDEPDPKLDLDYVPNHAVRRPVRAALVNAFAFGGTNGSLAVRRPDLALEPR